CNGCKEAVQGEAVIAMGYVWHSEHFQCHRCHMQISDSFRIEYGFPICCKCCLPPLACKKCGCSITGTFIEAMESFWHQKCFLCAACNDPFPGGVFYVFAKKPYDLDCYWGARLDAVIQAK
uniref:LIM zinc-binding domain-containing protein n=2 Tax=Parascaris univalens TaxID=6257 RepID=A0A915BHJ4_PARUN